MDLNLVVSNAGKVPVVIGSINYFICNEKGQIFNPDNINNFTIQSGHIQQFEFSMKISAKDKNELENIMPCKIEFMLNGYNFEPKSDYIYLNK